jgi:hypothetical protein
MCHSLRFESCASFLGALCFLGRGYTLSIRRPKSAFHSIQRASNRGFMSRIRYNGLTLQEIFIMAYMSTLEAVLFARG